MTRLVATLAVAVSLVACDRIFNLREVGSARHDANVTAIDSSIDPPPVDGDLPPPLDATDAMPDTMYDARWGAEAPPPPVCPTIPGCTGFQQTTLCNGTCFAECPTIVGQPSAEQLCQGWGGYLAQIDSAIDQSCVTSLTGGAAHWIGLTQYVSSGVPDDNWGWILVAQTSYSRWAQNEPNDGDNAEDAFEQCGVDYTSGWADQSCADGYPFVCKRTSTTAATGNAP